MMRKLSAGKVAALVEHLQARGTVIAPHRKGERSFAFQPVVEPGLVALDYDRTLLPLKKFFLPPQEELLSFDLKTNAYARVPVAEERKIFLGVHNYDLHAVLRVDKAYLKDLPESNYLKRRAGSLFAGVSYAPDKHHFSASLGISPADTTGFDLFLWKVGDGYLVEELTPAGAGLLSGFGALAGGEFVRPEEPKFPTRLRCHWNRLHDLLGQSYQSPAFDAVAQRCTSCGTCNVVCPTCYCFDVRDQVNPAVNAGKRERVWDACMAEPFAAVAGGENFRHSVASRQRHRVYRKFRYQSPDGQTLYCVGCGRCSRQCTAGIDMAETVNDLYERVFGRQSA